MSRPIPLVDLAAQTAEISDEVRRGWDEVVGRSAFVLGAEVERFEEEFAAFSSVAHCVGVANGTDALELALRALDVGPGAEVVLPANTFVATALAVARAGARPVLVDVDDDTLLVRPDLVAEALTPATRALLPVHLYGQCAPMADLLALAAERDLVVVEDAAQAQGAAQDGVGAGAFGVAAGTSFYPGKNLGAFGDAGAVLTRDAALDRRLRALRNYGSEVKYHHPEAGFNSRLDTLQAVVLRAKLRRLAAWNEHRRQAAARYHDLLGDLDEVRLPRTAPGNVHVWHLYVVRVPRRDAVLAALHEAGVGAGIHYPVPIHLQGAFAGLGQGPGSFPVTERAAADMVSLPICGTISPGDQERVAEVLHKALR
ncbi:MAG TPA: DegT/DnrJ/EryC1/StrS family aminotransferase [Acidimicrobiales bacterium]|nr:DegT/DnrJ/EryC1/StrS family aminotransferase [Acidimicrobiales bacterium]